MYKAVYEARNGTTRIDRYNSYSEALEAISAIAEKFKNNKDVKSITLRRSSDDTVLWDKDDCDELKEYLKYDKEQWSVLSSRTVSNLSDKPSIYFDMDGTLAYWYRDTKGMVYPDQVLDPNYHYFRDLEPHEFMVDFALNLKNAGYDVCIISSADKDTIRDKWEWLDNNCPFIEKENRFFAPLGADKTEFIKGNADKSIIIDDYEPNLNMEKWRTVMKAINSINSVNPKLFCIEGYSAEICRDNWDKVMQLSMDKVKMSIDKDNTKKRATIERSWRE